MIEIYSAIVYRQMIPRGTIRVQCFVICDSGNWWNHTSRKLEQPIAQPQLAWRIKPK